MMIEGVYLEEEIMVVLGTEVETGMDIETILEVMTEEEIKII